MKWLISLMALLLFSNFSYANDIETKNDRSLKCVDYDDENIYLKGQLKFNTVLSKYEVSAETIGYNSRENVSYDGESVLTTTNPASGLLYFETYGSLGAVYMLKSGTFANTYSGTARLKLTGATYTVNCTYSGPEFPIQGE